MKSCLHCAHANWQVAASGRLHPSGDGRCEKRIKVPKLPQAFYWFDCPPIPTGGFINRRKELKDHCVYWEAKK